MHPATVILGFVAVLTVGLVVAVVVIKRNERTPGPSAEHGAAIRRELLAARKAQQVGSDDSRASSPRAAASVDSPSSPLPRTTGALTQMMLAAGSGNDPEIRALYRAGFDVNAIDQDGDSVLFYAASRGRAQTIRLLLSLGANPNPAPGATAETPLTSAAQMSVGGPRPPGTSGEDFRAVVVALLQGGADPSQIYERGYRLVYWDAHGLVVIRVEDVSAFVLRPDLSVMLLTSDQGW